MTELRPCPECGSDNLIIMMEHTSGNRVIHCMDCHKYYDQLKLTREDTHFDIFEKWNQYAQNYKPEPKIEPALKPCPFCGSEAELRCEIDGRDETYAIHCNGCHMSYTKFDWRAAN